MKKKILSITLVAALMLGAFSAAYAGTDNAQTAGSTASDSEQAKTAEKAVGQEADFSDLKNTNWAYEAVNAMSQKGIVKGYADGTFKPNATVTYGEFIKLCLVAKTGQDIGNSNNGNWAKSYYDKALELGYLKEDDIKSSQLNQPITRACMAYVVSNVIDNGRIVSIDSVDKDFYDVRYNTPYCYYILKARTYGLIDGQEIGPGISFFFPDKTLTRAESAMVVYRLIDESVRVLPTDEQEAVEETAAEPKEETFNVGFFGTDKTFEKKWIKAKLGDYGIQKFEVLSNGNVAIFSTIRYDNICLIIDGKAVGGMGNINGTSYWEEDGYYIYVATPKSNGVDVTGKVPSVWCTDDEIITITDVTL